MSKDRHQPGSPGKPPPTAFDPIEAALRQMFNEVEREDVPDDFSELVAKFAKQQRKSKTD
jgi:hypothetical protein